MNWSRAKRIELLNQKWLSKTIEVKSNCTHPHASEKGEVIGFEVITSLSKLAMKVKVEKGKDFYIFNFKEQIICLQ